MSGEKYPFLEIGKYILTAESAIEGHPDSCATLFRTLFWTPD